MHGTVNKRTGFRVLLTAVQLLLAVLPAYSQSQISQNQDGFESSLYEGNLKDVVKRDSTVIQREVPKDYVQWTMNPLTGLMDFIGPDTVQYLFQNAHRTEGLKSQYSNLGNMGSPRISRIFSLRKDAPVLLFDTPLDHFITNPSEFRFTDTKTPHLNLTYFSGGNKITGDDHLKGYFAANFGKKTGIGINMDYIYGRGRYSNQATKMFDSRFYWYYHGDVYKLHLSLNTDHIKVTENGGITDDDYIVSPEKMAEGKKEYAPESIPVVLDRNWNNLNRTQMLIAQSLNLRSAYQRTDSIGDTVITRTLFREIGTFANTTEFGTLERRFIYYDTPAHYYEHDWLDNDSVDKFQNFYLDNTFSFNLNEGFSKWAIAGFRAFAKYEFRSYRMADTLQAGRSSEYLRRENEYSVIVGGSIDREKGKNLNLGVQAQTVVLGDRIGDFDLVGNIDLDMNLMKRPASLTARAMLSGRTPDYYMRHYHASHFWWDEDLDKEIRMRAEGDIRIDRTGTRLQAGFTNLNKYTYFHDNGTTYQDEAVLHNVGISQESSGIQVIDATLDQNLSLGVLHWDNSITWQYSSNQDVLPLPDLNVFSNLYLRFVYAKRLKIEFGGDVTWFSEYYAPDYSPAAGVFHTQNSSSMVKVGNYPMINVYANCVLRDVRFYVMVYHVNSGMDGDFGGPFWAPHYPMAPRMFKMGISWTFFD